MNFLANLNLTQIFTSIGFMPLLAVIFLLSMYVFWNETRKMEKPSNNIFDEWWLTIIITIIWGRVAYVVNNWAQFNDGFWQFAPYERYGDQVYLFRAMPWRLITVWDGGFLFSAMLVAFLVANLFFIVRFKRWRLREMFIPLILTQSFMLGCVLFVYGSMLNIESVMLNGAYIVLSVLIFKAIYWLLKKILKYNFSILTRTGVIISVIYTLLNTWLISSAFFSQELTSVDTLHVFAYIVITGIGLVLYLFDVNKKYNIANPADFGRQIVPTRNQAIKAGLISGDVTK